MLLITQQKKIPIIIYAKFLNNTDTEHYKVIDEEYLLFDYAQNEKEDYVYSQSECSEANLNKSAFVIQGIVCPNKEGLLLSKKRWKNIMNSVMTIILAGAADHRQYPDQEQDYRINGLNDEEYEYYKALALHDGFSLQNPTTFFIQHAYARKVRNMPISNLGNTD